MSKSTNVTIKKVKPSECFVDTSYQRELMMARSEAISEEHNFHLEGMCEVSARKDGTYAIIDGQHRIKARELLGKMNEPMDMRVHFGLSVQDEASLFFQFQDKRKGLNAWAKWRAGERALHKDILDIIIQLKEVGLKAVQSPRVRGPACVEALRYVHRKGNLKPTMEILTIWRNGDPDAYEGSIVRMMSSFLLVHPEVNVDDMAARLAKKYSPTTLRAKFKFKRDSYPGISDRDAAISVLRDIYNAGRKNADKLVPPGDAAE